MHILRFPEETIIHILEYLNFRTLISCSETCRHLHAIIQNASCLRYNSELEIAGLIDTGKISSLSVAERLEQLETIERNWGELNFRSKVVMPKPLGSNIWELFGGVLSLGTSGGRGLSFTELPALTRGTPARVWKHDDLGVNIRDFGIDPSQDLAVLIEAPTRRGNQGTYSIHFRSMRTGDQHRCAAEPIITCTPQTPRPSGGAPRYTFVIQIMGDFLGLLFQTPIGHDMRTGVAYVWNWKTGQMAIRRQSTDPYLRYDSFSFLSPRHIVISTHTPVIDADSPPALEIYDFMFPGIIDNPPSIRIFEFPLMHSGAVVFSTVTRSDPSPGELGNAATQGRPFVTAPTARLLTVNFQVFREVRGIADVSGFVMFVHHDSLLDMIELPGPTLVPWEEWGHNKTRLLPGLIESSWVCYVHGTRFVSMEREINSETPRIKLLDFNPSSIKRDLKLSEKESSRVTVFPSSEPTVIDRRGSVFVDTITTNLPYREVLSADEFRYVAVMIDDDCLVGIRREPTPDDPSVEFLCI